MVINWRRRRRRGAGGKNLMMLSLGLLLYCTLSFAAQGSQDDIPVELTCVWAAQPNHWQRFPCATAHYPPGIGAPPANASTEGCVGLLHPKELNVNRVPTGCVKASLGPASEAGTGIALVRRGECSFASKAAVAWAQGYSTLLIVNSQGAELMPPSLEGLQPPPPPPNGERSGASSPPLVAMIQPATVGEWWLMEETVQGMCVASVGEGEGERGGVQVRVVMGDAWRASDSLSLFQDGVRLGKGGRHAEAAEAHRSALEMSPEFLTAAYNYLNNLLRGNASTLVRIKAEGKRTGVLPIQDEQVLAGAFHKQTHSAFHRVYGFPASDASALEARRSRGGDEGWLWATEYPALPSDGCAPSGGGGAGVVFVTVSTDEEKNELSSLRASIEHAGGDLVVLGLGAEYGSHGGTKLALMEEWLAAVAGRYDDEDTLVVFVDAYDVLVTPSASVKEFRRRFEAMNVSLVISGETGCWPDPGVAMAYPWPFFEEQPQFGNLYSRRAPEDLEAARVALDGGLAWPPNVPFPYPNSGGYMARMGYMRRTIHEVMDDMRKHHVEFGLTVGDGDDQRWLQRHWLRHPTEVSVDVFAEVFLSLHRCCPPGGSNSSIALGASPSVLDTSVEWSGEDRDPPLPEEIAPVSPAPYGGADSGRSTVWLAVDHKTAVSPLVIHGNGHGKRLFRVLSCALGMYCKWRDGDDAALGVDDGSFAGAHDAASGLMGVEVEVNGDDEVAVAVAGGEPLVAP